MTFHSLDGLGERPQGCDILVRDIYMRPISYRISLLVMPMKSLPSFAAPELISIVNDAAE